MTINPKEIFAPYFEGQAETKIVRGYDSDAYRADLAFAPSDLKCGDERLRSRGGRGHFLHLAAKLRAQQLEKDGQPVPEALRIPERVDSEAAIVGSLYHAMLLEPEMVMVRYVCLDREVKEEILDEVKQRKRVEILDVKYSGRIREAQEWKAEKGSLPKTDEEKQQVLQAHVDRRLREELEGIEWSERRPEVAAWKEANAGKIIVSQRQWNLAQAMVNGINSDPWNAGVRDWLRDTQWTPGDVEMSLYGVTPSCSGKFDLGGVPIKGRPDVVSPDRDWILDPKTCLSVHEDDFARQVENLGYDVSMGAYSYLSQLHGLQRPRALFLAQEKTPPFRARLHELSFAHLNWGACRFLGLTRELKAAYLANEWDIDEMGEPYAGPITIQPGEWRSTEIDKINMGVLTQPDPFALGA